MKQEFDPGDVLAPFASFGEDIDVSVPGVELLGVDPTSPDGAVRWSGTSSSTAVTTGGQALLRELLPGAAPGALGFLLQETSFDHRALNPGHEGHVGRGRLDPAAACE